MRARLLVLTTLVSFAGAGCGSDDSDLRPVEQPEGVFGIPNLDDDDRNGVADWDDQSVVDDDDLTRWSLPMRIRDAIVEDGSVELRLADPSHVRFYRDGVIVLGTPPSSSAVDALQLTKDESGRSFGVTFADFAIQTELLVRQLDADGIETAREVLPVASAPLLLNHHLQPVERVWMVADDHHNLPLRNVLEEVLGSRLTVLSDEDVWIQDQLEWAYLAGPGGLRLDVAINSIRARYGGLASWVDGLAAPGVCSMSWGASEEPVSQDSFGNLEVTPPHTARGIHYPFGRIYWGARGTAAPNAELRDFLTRQALQAPIAIDTSWLCVGHVDEIVSFIPDPDSDLGFKLLIADTDAAYDVLATTEAETYLPRLGAAEGYYQVADLVADDEVRALNRRVQDDYLSPIREQFAADMELSPDDIIAVPALFRDHQACTTENAPVAVLALIPDLLNLLVVNVEGEPVHLVVPDPMFRTASDEPDADPFIIDFKNRMPAKLRIHHVDNWLTYHRGGGGVHCGTNALRTPTGQWWTEGLHLLP